jgi:predicted Fe-S protein YdhL (DUF1289 family)
MKTRNLPSFTARDKINPALSHKRDSGHGQRPARRRWAWPAGKSRAILSGYRRVSIKNIRAPNAAPDRRSNEARMKLDGARPDGLRGVFGRRLAMAARVAGRRAGSANISRFSATACRILPTRPQPGFLMASNLHDLPDSPCIGVCSTLFDDICKGCGRTALEVSNWVFMSDDEKRAVWARIEREGTAMRFQPRRG